MAREVCDALAKECDPEAPKNNGAPYLVFLVGGAGNGKSELARHFLSQVKATRLTPPSQFSQRKYEFELSTGKRLAIVNDATIPPEQAADEGPLAGEISNAISTASHLLACVNRGVLIGEARQGQSGDSIQDAVIRWLLSPSGEWPSGGSGQTVADCNDRGHYRFLRLAQDGNTIATIHVVFMDYLSLVESADEPQLASGGLAAPLDPPKLVLAPILQRNHDEGGVATFAQPLAYAASKFLDKEDPGVFDPIWANAKVLSKPAAANALCSIFRGAEVRAGSHFTYRDLWALFGHAIVGPATPSSFHKLAEWVSAKAAQASSQDPKEKLAALVSLANLRSHMLLFDAGKPGFQHSEPGDGFDWAVVENESLHAVRSVDPLRDFGPGGGAEYNELLDQLTGVEGGKLPSASIQEGWPSFCLHWTEFDASLEKAVVDALDPEAGKSDLHYRNAVLSWFGKYMFRLVAVAKGWPAHCSLVDRWQKSWNLASQSKQLDKEIERSVLSIILPKAEGVSETYFPVLRSRVETLRGSDQAITIEVPRNKFDIKALANGDSIIIELERSGGLKGSAANTVLDFHLLREALSRDGNFGFTDSLAVIEPRLERIRASVLAHQMGDNSKGQNFKVTYRGGRAELVA